MNLKNPVVFIQRIAVRNQKQQNLNAIVEDVVHEN